MLLPAKFAPDQDSPGVHYRSLLPALAESILLLLPDNRGELTFCPPVDSQSYWS
jgi:hypothetical protein